MMMKQRKSREELIYVTWRVQTNNKERIVHIPAGKTFSLLLY